MDTLVKKAYDNWMHVVEYDGKSLLSSKQNSSSSSGSRSDTTTVPQNYSDSFDHHQLSLPVSVPSEQASMNLGLPVGGNCIFTHKYRTFLTCFEVCTVRLTEPTS